MLRWFWSGLFQLWLSSELNSRAQLLAYGFITGVPNWDGWWTSWLDLLLTRETYGKAVLCSWLSPVFIFLAWEIIAPRTSSYTPNFMVSWARCFLANSIFNICILISFCNYSCIMAVFSFATGLHFIPEIGGFINSHNTVGSNNVAQTFAGGFAYLWQGNISNSSVSACF